MTKQNNRELLGIAPISSLIPKFALPAIISGLVGAFYNIADQIFIGQSIGVLGNATTNVLFPLTTISTGIAYLIGIGGSARFNLSLGAKNEEKAGFSVGNALTLILLVSLTLVVLCNLLLSPILQLSGATAAVMPLATEYGRITILGLPFFMSAMAASQLVRADANPQFSMFILMIGSIINLILDPIFIFGFNMGIAGAAWATVVGQAVSFILSIYYFRYRFHSIKLSWRYTRLHWQTVKKILGLGITPFNAFISMMLVQIVLNNTLTHYGAQSKYGSEIPLAVVGIISKINYIFVAINIGMIQGAQPIVGFNYGAKKYDRVLNILRYIVIRSLIIGSISFICFQVFPRQLASIFGGHSELFFEFAEQYFRIFMVMCIFNGLLPVTGNFFTAIGKPIYGVMTSLSRRILTLIPLLLILPHFIGIKGVLYAGPIADSVAIILAVILLTHRTRIIRKKLHEPKENHTSEEETSTNMTIFTPSE